MELQLKAMSVPPRFTIQKKLLSVFGSTVDGKHTKEQREARQVTVDGRGAANKNKAAIATTSTTTTTKGKRKAQAMEKKVEKTTVKGKAAGKKKTKDSSDEEDEEDVDEEGEDVEEDEGGEDDGVDSTYLDSDEDVEIEEDDDDREARARARQANAQKKQLALVDKNEEFNEIQKILVEKKVDGKKAPAAVLNFDRTPPSFFHTWKKVSRISADHSRIAKRGLALIDWTTWEWKAVPTNSFSRVMRTFAAAAIAESAAIISYRHELLLCHEDGGAATLRLRAQEVMAAHLRPRDPGETSTLIQTTLKDIIGSASQGWKAEKGEILTEGNLPPKDSITWADGIYPTVPEGGIMEHLIEVELPRLQRECALGAQQRAVQKAINGVQHLRMAWHDPTSSATARENPPLDGGVASALRTLVEVSANHRTCPHRSLIGSARIPGVERECIPSTRQDDTHAGIRPERGDGASRAPAGDRQVRHARRAQPPGRYLLDGSAQVAPSL